MARLKITEPGTVLSVLIDVEVDRRDVERVISFVRETVERREMIEEDRFAYEREALREQEEADDVR